MNQKTDNCKELRQLPRKVMFAFADASNSLRPADAYMRHPPRPLLVEIMACRLVGAKPLSEPMLEYFNSNLRNKLQWNIKRNSYIFHYDDVIMSAIASQITSLTIVYSTVYPGADQRKHQSSASLAFVWEIHRGPVNSPHKWPVTRKMFPFDDVIMIEENAFENVFFELAAHLPQCNLNVLTISMLNLWTLSFKKCKRYWKNLG